MDINNRLFPAAIYGKKKSESSKLPLAGSLHGNRDPAVA